MNLSSENYWQALGVPIWKLRNAKPALLEDYQSYLLLGPDAKTLAVVLAEAHSVEEQDLLTNIVNALSAQLKTIDISTLVKPSSDPWIIFGQALQRHVMHLNLSQPFVFCSLQDMLKNPSLKKDVWQKIRVFKKPS